MRALKNCEMKQKSPKITTLSFEMLHDKMLKMKNVIALAMNAAFLFTMCDSRVQKSR